jgi:hypothetical protein
MTQPQFTVTPKLLAYFKQRALHATPEECWLWGGEITRHGYGRAHCDYQRLAAHRLSWIIQFGDIPDGLFVCHHCDVKRCVNPNHLFLGTQSENIQDMIAKDRGRAKPGERHPASKLTAEQVGFIRANYIFRHPEFGQAPLAKRFGVSSAKIGQVVHRKCWKHI